MEVVLSSVHSARCRREREREREERERREREREQREWTMSNLTEPTPREKDFSRCVCLVCQRDEGKKDYESKTTSSSVPSVIPS